MNDYVESFYQKLYTFHPPNINKAKTGENIRKLRKGHMLTARQLGAALHVRSQEISRWETGYVLPSTDNIVAIAALFGVMYEDILATE